MSANISINESNLCIDIKGIHKILSFKSQLKIPLDQVESVERNSEAVDTWYKGIRATGINIPNVITAGTFYQHGEKIFWDVKNSDKSIIINLKDNSFSKVIVEVDDPDAVTNKIQSSIQRG
jgi:hypothetical protein